ncbi:MAG: hypothetical protein DRI48_07270, partial [Chloroflexi bacterium]
MRNKVLYLVIILSLLAPSVTVTAAPVPAEEPAPVVQEAETTSYLLQLDMPEVDVPQGTQPADVPGVYHGALARQWTEVEGVLKALQEQGLVESYTLLPEANAFSVTAQPAAESQLQQLGALSEQGMMAQAAQAETDQFQAQLGAAIQEAQERAAPMEQEPVLQEQEPSTQDYLVRLAAADDATAAEQQHELVGYLEWLKDLGEVESYEWLPQANGFRVSAGGELERLSGRPEVAEIAPYSEEALQDAQAALEEARAETSAAAPLAPLGITAYTPTTPTVNIQIYSNWVSGQAITGTVYVTVTKATDGIQYTGQETLSSPGGYSIWLSMPYPIEPGDTVQAYQDGGSGLVTIVVPDLRPMIDRDADTVSGKTPVPITSSDENSPPALRVNSWSLLNRSNGNWEGDGNNPLTDAAGNYTTWFTYTVPTTGTYDIRPFDTDIWVVYFDANHNSVSIVQYAPGVRVQLNADYAEGYTKPRTAYTITLKNSAGIVKGRFTGTAGTNGWFYGNFRDVYGNTAKSAAGDTVTLEGAYNITVPVVNLTALADPLADIVTGTAPANITSTSSITLPNLSVRNDDTWITQYVTTTATGKYLANDVGNINPDTRGETRYYNTNGDQVYHRFRAPIVYVRGAYDWWQGNHYSSDSHVSGYAAMGNTLVTLNLKRGGSTIATAYDMADDNGYYEADFTDDYDNPVDIQGGDTVEVSAGDWSTTVDVPTFDVTSDPDEDRVVGTTDATVVTDTHGLTQTLAVWPTSTYDWDYGKHVMEEVTGTLAGFFVAENPFYDEAWQTYDQRTLDWGPGEQGHLRYVDANGNRVYDDFQAPEEYAKPIVYVRGDYWNNRYYPYNDNYVSGYAEGCYYEPVSIVIQDGDGNAKGQTTTNCDWNGHFSASSYTDRYGNNVNIEAGDTVAVTFEGQTTEVDVPEFDFTSDPDEDMVYGTTDATVVTDTYGLTQTLAVWPMSYYDSDYGKYVMEEVTGTLAGFFVAENPFYEWANPANPEQTLDWGPGEQGHLRYVDAGGNYVYARFEAPREYAKPVVYVRGRWRRYSCSTNYESDRYVSGRAVGCNSDPATVVLKDANGNVKDQRQAYCCADERFYTWMAVDIKA